MALMQNAKSLLRRAFLIFRKLRLKFIGKSEVSGKSEINKKSFVLLGTATLLIYIGIVFMMPDEPEEDFTQKSASSEPAKQSTNTSPPDSKHASDLWESGHAAILPSIGANEVNHNTSMIIGNHNGNAKTQLRAGLRLPLRILDKFVVSQEAVPILAELTVTSSTDSGLTLPAGTRFYGEASFEKGSERATVRFKQISLPSGEIRPIQGSALGKDGQPGITGRVFTDGVKNTTGSVITTFVGGLASGSMEVDAFGRSRGGLENGLLTAVSATAKERAQAYGEKLKAEREWIEVGTGTECDAILNESINLQNMGGE